MRVEIELLSKLDITFCHAFLCFVLLQIRDHGVQRGLSISGSLNITRVDHFCTSFLRNVALNFPLSLWALLLYGPALVLVLTLINSDFAQIQVELRLCLWIARRVQIQILNFRLLS